MLLFLMGIFGPATYSVAHPGVTDVKSTQQAGACTGIVKDVAGEPIIGVSVAVKGTSTGTITGLDGRFSFANAKKGDIIRISYVGYVTQEIKWEGKLLNIIMQEDSRALDEVVVVGYAVQKR